MISLFHIYPNPTEQKQKKTVTKGKKSICNHEQSGEEIGYVSLSAITWGKHKQTMVRIERRRRKKRKRHEECENTFPFIHFLPEKIMQMLGLVSIYVVRWQNQRALQENGEKNKIKMLFFPIKCRTGRTILFISCK